MTGCGCLILVSALIAMLAIFVRGSTDAGEPYEQILALSLVLLVAVQAARVRVRTIAKSRA